MFPFHNFFGDVFTKTIVILNDYCLAIKEKRKNTKDNDKHYSTINNTKNNDELPAKRVRYSTKVKNDPNRKSRHLTILEVLNGYCIQEIFSYLSLSDLSNVADTNQQFRQLVQSYLPLKYKAHFRLEHIKSKTLKESASNVINLKCLGHFFRNFGHFFESAELHDHCQYDSNSLSKEVFELIAKYCKASLNRLVFRDFYALNLTQIMQQTKFEALQVVHIHDAYTYDFLSPRSDWHSFIRNHPNLKELIFACFSINLRELDLIAQVMRNLEVLQFNLSWYKRATFGAELNEILISLGSIQSLKKCILHCIDQPVAVESLLESFVLNNVGIEHLHLSNMSLYVSSMAFLGNMNSLKTLCLDKMNLKEPLTFDHCIHAITKLPLLEKLILKTSGDQQTLKLELLTSLLQKPSMNVLQIVAAKISVNIRQYNQLLNILKSRPKKMEFSIDSFALRRGCIVSNNMIHKNLEWISVTSREDDESEGDERDSDEIVVGWLDSVMN